MAIDKNRLFERARERWPLVFRVMPVEGVPCFESKPCIAEVYRDIEASSQPEGEGTPADEWKALAHWSFHQALWALAQQVEWERDLHRDEVTFEMFDEWIRSNLAGDDCWRAERQEYEESPSRFH
ncbi:MAG: hypothetical protein Q7J32_19170 [Sphingomonadaceae bacterium]|nr:hypothetical protein [Sphingomonadaceae bacterium]